MAIIRAPGVSDELACNKDNRDNNNVGEPSTEHPRRLKAEEQREQHKQREVYLRKAGKADLRVIKVERGVDVLHERITARYLFIVSDTVRR